MAVLGRWTGGSTGLLPGSSWAAPNGLFPTEARNDLSTYTFTSSTSTLTLPSSNLADGYLFIARTEIEDTSNGRHNPSGRIIQSSGTGNFTGPPAGGYSRNTNNNQAFISCWAFIDNPSGSSSFQFQWQYDSEAATGGSINSSFDVIPLYYSDAGVFSGDAANTYGGTTPNVVTLDTDVLSGSNITRSGNTVTVSGDNKRYLVISGQFTTGMSGRTQRWLGHLYDGSQDRAAQSYIYMRSALNDELGGHVFDIIETTTADRTVELFAYRGDGTAVNEGGADLDKGPPSSWESSLVILELNGTTEVFRANSTSTQDISVTGPVDINIADSIGFNDSSSWTDGGANTIVGQQSMDALLGANIGGASTDLGTDRFEARTNITVNGSEDSEVFHGNYLRGDQAGNDTFGWASNPVGFVSLSSSDAVGASVTKTGDSHDVSTQSGWVGFWGINLDSLKAPSPIDGSTASASTVPVAVDVAAVIVGDSGGSSSASGTIQGIVSLEAASTGSSTTSASLSAIFRASGSSTGSSSATARPALTIPVQGNSSARAWGLAELVDHSVGKVDQFRKAKLSDSGFDIYVHYYGVTAPTLSNPATGVYRLSVPTKTKILSLLVEGNSDHVDEDTALTIDIIDTDGFAYYLIHLVTPLSSGVEIDKHASHVIDYTEVSSNQVKNRVNNLAYGTTGYRIIFTPSSFVTASVEGITGASTGASTSTGTIAATAPIDGSSSGTSTVSATLVGTGRLQSSTSGISSGQGDIGATGELVGSGGGTSTADATVGATGTLVGSSAGTSTATGTLVAKGSLVGAVGGTCTSTGGLGADGELLGSVDGVSTITATLTATGAVFSSSGGISSSSATLAGTGDLSSSVSTSSGSSGTLQGDGDLQTSVTGTATVTATVMAEGELLGSVTSTSTATGSLTASGKLEGSTSGLSATSGTLVSDVSISGQSEGTSTAAGTLVGTGELTGTSDADSSVTGNVQGRIRITGSTQGGSVVSGSIAGTGFLKAITSGSSTVQGYLSNSTVSIFGQSEGISAVQGGLSGNAYISGQSDGYSSVSGTILSGNEGKGEAFGSSFVSGTLVGKGAISGTISGTSSGIGTVFGRGEQKGVINCTSTTTGTLRAKALIEGQLAGSSNVSGDLEGIAYLSGTASGNSTAQATGYVFGTRYVEGVASGSSTTIGDLSRILPKKFPRRPAPKSRTHMIGSVEAERIKLLEEIMREDEEILAVVNTFLQLEEEYA